MADFTPTGAFSFEIWTRSKTTGRKARRLTESFFLLGPTEQSIDEGYKLTVNKTMGGAWIDDFGNDVKKISVAGSLYTYYLGVPSSAAPTDLPSIPGLEAGAAAAIDVGQGILAGPTGISALDEFFKLRYILSRFRDSKSIGGFAVPSIVPSPGEVKLFSVFPELSQLYVEIATGREANNENFVFIYHDYDDGNHFEVIIEKFMAKRSASDPFTVNYNIEMTAIAPDSSDLRTFGKTGRGLKETAISVSKGASELFNKAFSDLKELTGIDSEGSASEAAEAASSIPAGLKKEFDSIINLTDNFKDTLDQFTTGVRSDSDVLKADAVENRDKIDFFKVQFIAASLGISEDDLINENADIDDIGALEIYNSFTKISFQLAILSGIDFYGNNNENQNVFLEEDQPSVRDTDFDSETQGGGVTGRAQNASQSVQIIYYVVEQGDTLARLGNKFYGDFTLGSLIGQVNRIDNKDIEQDKMLGESIKIPLLGTPIELQNDTNLVYSLITQRTPISTRQTQVLGSDIKLSDGDRAIVVDGTGDLAVVSGVECYQENIKDRFAHKQGILGPAVPGFGLPLSQVGEIPEPLRITKIIEFMETQAYSDPRTKIARVQRDTLSLKADTIRAKIMLRPLSGSEDVIDIGKVIPGSFI
jgi:hypothetical protein